ncbi:hypothetical protein EZV73_04240 [Acidaminobacter sp. JC074]|uniref:PEP/pyruvate-binding domain-containing protein n=1 Tax=Acidaminobacter sp. JC074 TaxID=2530199 RepID=UPI001F0F6600|nr:PEP/pyruvate-binding domain-containing protein [Acidaminobacter sp. JC074]MCH4886762.1 hypothetical protein [Acidaminobacter sp. JC074]
MIYMFNEKTIPAITSVGGKAKALMETTKFGLPVPEGYVMSVDFFGDWLNEIKSSELFISAIKETTKENCELLKSFAESLTFSENQEKLFLRSQEQLTGDVFAIRSSSPEEDLEDTSFAGMYDTFLGVTSKMLKAHISRAFASCFDYRVMSYKKQNSIDLSQTSIAVIVQRQIASDISGVGFSLNPLNNCFDEVTINSSFGLGEAIVSGIVTPDMYTYDIVDKKIITKKISIKDIGLWLNSDGGIEKKENEHKEKESLMDSQVTALVDLIKLCEKHYGFPVDTEWTFSDNKLYLLQVRPITTHFPFYKELLTEPGKNKRFYIDLIALTQGFDEPMSVLGMELWSDMLLEIKMHMMSPQANGSTPALYGKEYFSITAFQKVVGKKAGLKFVNSYDSNVRKIFEEIDLDLHPFEGPVVGTEQAKKRMFKSVLTMIPGALQGVFGNYQKGIKNYLKISESILSDTDKLSNKGSFSKLSADALKIMNEAMGTAPVIFAGMISKANMAKIFKGEDVEKELSAMNMDLDGNPTSEMGHLLYKMASEKTFIEVTSKEEFKNRLSQKRYSNDFLALYDEFMDKFSARGFKEIDVASKRVYEDIGILYDKLKEINLEDNQMLTVKLKRDQAYNRLLDVARKKGKEKKFVNAANRMKATFGYREHPKYLIVMIMAKLHDICLEIAEKWVKEGRIDKSYDIFDLKSAQIDKGQNDSSFDLRQARKENLDGYIHKADWPLVIDSRGKIYKPKMQVEDGDIIGDAIAPGKVVGKAKVLRLPYEKPLESGEILIAKFTEPSWTPIFTNASGVVMEIGGPLQHGGIIAREYGIPCVSGLMGIMDLVKDGDLLEVDGYNGVVKILESN